MKKKKKKNEIKAKNKQTKKIKLEHHTNHTETLNNAIF